MYRPDKLEAIERETERCGFTMASDRETGALLRTLAASKPGGRMLELGTGTGLSACWILSGMDQHARLITVDNDPQVQRIAVEQLDDDPRITIVCANGAEYLSDLAGTTFDLIFADAWPGKFNDLDDALGLLVPGGVYVVDDLLPQPSWPAGHAPKVPLLVESLRAREDLAIVEMGWSTGILVASKTSD